MNPELEYDTLSKPNAQKKLIVDNGDINFT